MKTINYSEKIMALKTKSGIVLSENYEDAGVRKAVLLARYIDYLKDNLPSNNYD